MKKFRQTDYPSQEDHQAILDMGRLIAGHFEKSKPSVWNKDLNDKCVSMFCVYDVDDPASAPVFISAFFTREAAAKFVGSDTLSYIVVETDAGNNKEWSLIHLLLRFIWADWTTQDDEEQLQ